MPVPKLGGPSGVEHDPRQIVRAGEGLGGDFVRAKSGTTPVTQLRQRAGILGAPRKVTDTHIDPILWIGGFAALKLFFKEGNQVPWMKTVANLRTAAIEPDIFQGLLFFPGSNPEGENPLIGSTELTSARQNTATVDPNRKPKSFGILQRKKF